MMTRENKMSGLFKDLLTTFAYSDYNKLLIVVFIQGVLSGIIAPVFPLWLSDQYNFDMGELFYILALSGVGTAFLNLGAGRISDHLGNRKVYLQITVALAIVRSLIFAIAPNIWLVIIVNWFTQISTSAVVYSLVSDKIKSHPIDVKPGSINSYVRIIVAIGLALGQPLGLFIYGRISATGFFVTYSLGFTFLLVLASLWIKNEAQPPIKARKDVRKGSIAAVKVGFTICLSVCLIYCGNQSINTILVLRISEKFGSGSLGTMLSYTTCIETILYLFAGRFMDRFGINRTLFMGILCGCLYYALLAFASELYVFYILQALYAVQIALLFLSLMTFVQTIYHSEPGYANALFFSALMIASTTSNFYVGYMSRFGTRWLLLSFVVLMLLGITLLISMGKPTRKNEY